MKNLVWIGIFLLYELMLSSCGKVTSYPGVPSIDYESYKLVDTIDDPTLRNPVKMLEVTFKFVDGDGDLFTPDTSVRSLFLTFYNKVDGSFVQVPDSTLFTKPAISFPYSSLMDRSGQNKTQKGTITFDYPFYYPLPYDTIELQFYIQDVAGNKSNVVLIPKEIPFK